MGRWAILSGLVATVSACGGISSSSLTGGTTRPVDKQTQAQLDLQEQRRNYGPRGVGESIFSLFGGGADPNISVGVNKYLWRASLEVLNFLPIQSADPFTGVIVTGYGTPPGGGRSYRATIYVQDPALDARSLKVALATSGGPVDATTVRAVEDAILTRARQLRVQDSNF